MTLDLLVDLITMEAKGADYLVEIAVAYSRAGAGDVVDLSEALKVSESGGGQVALLAGCDMCPNAGDNRFKRGNANCDFVLDITDAHYILAFLYTGGPPPIRFDAADVDDNGALEITDAISLLNYLFQGGPPPKRPFTYLGLDPTQDGFESGCDLIASRFREFNCFSGDRDVDGMPGADAVWISQNITFSPPRYELRFEKTTDAPWLQRLPYFEFGASPDIPKLLAVGQDNVTGKPAVYVICFNRTVYSLVDSNEFSGIQIPIDFDERYLRLVRAEQGFLNGIALINNADDLPGASPAEGYGVIFSGQGPASRRLASEGEVLRAATLYFDVLESAAEIESTALSVVTVGTSHAQYPAWVGVHHRDGLGIDSAVVRSEIGSIFTRAGVFSLRAPAAVLRGDANSDGALNVADPVAVLGYLFQDGQALACPNAADFNLDSRLDITDPISLLRTMFLGAPVPGGPDSPRETRCR
jgi:hypothetical protein